MRIKKINFCLKSVGYRDIVSVLQRHVLAASGSKAPIGGRHNSHIVLIFQHDDAVVLEFSKNARRIVSRTVIDNNKFKVPKGLVENTFDRRTQKPLPVENGYHDRENRRVYGSLVARIRQVS